MLPIYYINLQSRADRRAFMEQQLARLGLSGVRVDAVTPADLGADEVARYCNPTLPRYLRPKELACTRSHESAWRLLLASGQERGIILEDDAELSGRLPQFLEQITPWDVDLLRIETVPRMRVFPAAGSTASGIELLPFRSTPLGASGYIIKASAAARIIGHPGLRRRQTDLALYSPFEEPGASLSRLQSFPALCRQIGDGPAGKIGTGRSDIDVVEEPHLFRTQHPVRYRLGRTGEQLWTGLRNVGDHLANRKRGLRRIAIPFADDSPIDRN